MNLLFNESVSSFYSIFTIENLKGVSHRKKIRLKSNRSEDTEDKERDIEQSNKDQADNKLYTILLNSLIDFLIFQYLFNPNIIFNRHSTTLNDTKF